MAKTKIKKLSASLEDYIEAIFNLGGGNDVVRSKDIADTLGVAKSSVTGALRLLKEKGMVNYKPYGYVTLTETGRKVAHEVGRKHDILQSFFTDVLGVEPDIAQKSACKTEHSLGPEVIGRLLSFIEYVTQSNENGYDLIKEFKKFCKSKTKSREPNRGKDLQKK
jgi:DtxR family Mn-dependent transcriptional regulator